MIEASIAPPPTGSPDGSPSQVSAASSRSTLARSTSVRAPVIRSSSSARTASAWRSYVDGNTTVEADAEMSPASGPAGRAMVYG